MSRLLRYGIFVVLVGLLTWMCVRLDWMEGYLPSAHESLLYILEFACPVLVATVAWDISGFDIRYVRATAKSHLRLLIELLWPPLLSACVAAFVCLTLLIWRYTRQTPAGEPWWGMYLEYLLLIGLTIVIGAIVGVLLRHRRRLASVVAIVAVVCIMAARNYGRLRMPYVVAAVDQFSFPDLIAHEPGVMYLIVSVIVTVVAIVAGCFFLTKNHSGKSMAIIALTVFLSGTAVLSFFKAEPMVARSAPEKPVCTNMIADVRYCGWPEETALIESAGPKWATYVDAMDKIGLRMAGGTYGLSGTSPDYGIDPFGHYDGALYRSITETVLRNKVSEKCTKVQNLSEIFSLTDMLNTWAAFAFKNPKQSDSMGRNTPRAQWVLSRTEGKPMEEQIAVMKPIAEDLLACGSLGRAVMS